MDSSSRTTAAVRTTALYQPPEAALVGRLGPNSDIYCLGLTTFELVNGLLPYASLDAAEVDRRINQGKRALPDRMLQPQVFAPHVPNRLVRPIRKTVETASGHRIQTASELARKLPLKRSSKALVGSTVLALTLFMPVSCHRR